MKRPWLQQLTFHAAEQWPAALVALALWCAFAPLALPRADATSIAPAASEEWPHQWQGRDMQPLALSAVEHRFAQRFPGRIARFAVADEGELVLREVDRPTRMLHPAADCWRGIGWRITGTRLERDGSAALWRCFEAHKDGQRVRVCERIVDAQGQAYTDSSAWFWAASLGRSTGPWQAITQVRALP